jgi:urea transporter
VSSKNINIIIKGTLNSYSQIFFSDNKIFGSILLLVSFFDVYAGLAGILSVLVSNSLAKALGYSEFKIRKGTYGFNNLLVGLGLGLTYTPGPETLIVVVFASITTLLITIALEGFLGKYTLPYLSIPFLAGMWIIILAGRDLSALGISERGIYTTNEIYHLGGKLLTDIYVWADNIEKPLFLKTYFLSLGAIFFQYNIFAGILIALGILIYSRISFILSLLGFTTAFLFYKFLGADITQYGYSYIGFNYILTAIAIGGHFLVPNKYSFLAVVLLLPIVVLFTLSTSRLLAPYQLPVFSLPFNVVVILFLYFLKLRIGQHKYLKEIITQLNNPEKNLYFYNQAEKRFKWLSFFPVSLPFMGEWTVSQAENGEYTHQGEWKYAWDFVIINPSGKQYSGSGDYPKDYYCYDKNVIAPAEGIVVEVIDGIEDNVIGEVNLLHNWGNSVVIKHTEYLYSQLSHLKKGTLKVKKGDFVQQGDILGRCGNSGRSPYPHLHFQMQATPYVGSKTLDYPIDHYIRTNDKQYKLYSYSKPQLNDKVSKINVTDLLKNAFNLIPGKKLECTLNGIKESWEIKTDYYNNTFIHCKQTNSFAHLFNDGSIHYFKSFTGDKSSALFFFYLALYQVPLGYYENMVIEDTFPPDIIKNKSLLIINDLFAPFYPILKSKYKLEYISIDNELMPDRIELESTVEHYFNNKKVKKREFKITITGKGISSIQSDSGVMELINN